MSRLAAAIALKELDRLQQHEVLGQNVMDRLEKVRTEVQDLLDQPYQATRALEALTLLVTAKRLKDLGIEDPKAKEIYTKLKTEGWKQAFSIIPEE